MTEQIHTGETIADLKKLVMNAEIKAGIERSEASTDSETVGELNSAISQGF